MRALTTLVSITSLLLVPITSAAQLSCEEITNAEDPSPLITRDKLVQFKSLVDSGSVPPISMPQGQTQDVPLPGSDLKICIQNQFIFLSTTVFPDELSEFLGLAIGCFDQGQKPSIRGMLDGDTSLNIDAALVSNGVNCQDFGT